MANTIKFLALLMVVAAVSAQDGGYGHHEVQHHPKYDFKYGVNDPKTHDIHSHSEHRDGDKTEGEYSLVEPDGTTRTVKYHVHGKSGFIAQVIRSGHAVHPQVHHVAPVHVAPVYHHVATPVVHHAPVYQQVIATPSHGHATSFQGFNQFHHQGGASGGYGGSAGGFGDASGNFGGF